MEQLFQLVERLITASSPTAFHVVSGKGRKRTRCYEGENWQLTFYQDFKGIIRGLPRIKETSPKQRPDAK